MGEPELDGDPEARDQADLAVTDAGNKMRRDGSQANGLDVESVRQSTGAGVSSKSSAQTSDGKLDGSVEAMTAAGNQEAGCGAPAHNGDRTVPPLLTGTAITASPPMLPTPDGPSPLAAPAISHALERDRLLPGRRSSSSFSSVHFADPTLPPGRKRTESDASASASAAGSIVTPPNGSESVSARSDSRAGHSAPGLDGLDPLASGISHLDTNRPVPTSVPSYTPSRLSVSRPILRSRSSDGTSRSDHPLPSPTFRPVNRRESASGTSTPRASMSRRASGDPLNMTNGSLKRDRSASRSTPAARQDGDIGMAASVEKLQVRHQRSRTGSLITRGTRTSAVTGGYESSSASDTEQDALTSPLAHAVSPTASMGHSNSVAGPSRPRRLGSASSTSGPGHGSPTRSFPDFALDTTSSLPHGASSSFALSRKRAKSLTLGGASSLALSNSQASPRRASRAVGADEAGELRHTYGMHTPPLPMERSGSDKSIHRRRNAPVSGLIGSAQARDPLRRVGSSPRQIKTALPSLGSASGATGIRSISSSIGHGGAGSVPGAAQSLEQDPEQAQNGSMSSSGVFSRGPSRMPSHHSTFSARSTTQSAPLAPRTPPGPSRISSRILRVSSPLAESITEGSSTMGDRYGRGSEDQTTYSEDLRRAERNLADQRVVAQAEAPASDGRKRDKGKQRADAPRRDGLAASLGLTQGNKDMILTAEQIHSLLSGSDVASALRSAGSGTAMARTGSLSMSAGRNGPNAGGAGAAGATTSGDRERYGGDKTTAGRTGASGQGQGQNQGQRREPYLASAPPALTSGAGERFSRERTISISTVGTHARRDLEKDTDDGNGDGSDETGLPAAGPSNQRDYNGGEINNTSKRTPSNAATPGSALASGGSAAVGAGAPAKRRRSSRLSHGENEGHVAFTHFPRPHRSTFIESDEESSKEAGQARRADEDGQGADTRTNSISSTSRSQTGLHIGHANGAPPTDDSKRDKGIGKLTKSVSAKSSLRDSLLGHGTPDRKDGEKEKRHRSISAIFHLPGKKRKSESMQILAHIASASPERDGQTDQELEEAERARREKEAKESNMRRKEAERREDEEGQERYYRALMQVTAHPHSVKLSDRAKVHLWAYYQHVFDGLEEPPRLNPLAVIRWRSRTEEQNERRHTWESEHGHVLANGNGIGNGTGLDRYRPSGSDSLSPMTQPRPLSLSPSPYKARSLAMSDQSHSHSQSHRSVTSDDSWHHAASAARQHSKATAQTRWTYSIDDIEGYKAAEGVVRYFIPPPLPAASVKESTAEAEVNKLTALEHPDEQDGNSGRQAAGDEASSTGGSIGRGVGPGLRFSNEGMSRERVDEMGVITEDRPMPSRQVSYLNGSRTSIDALSRSVSRDIDRHDRHGGTSLRRGHGGGSLRKSASTSHRHTHSITAKLLAPFEKVGELVKEGARRQSTSPYPHGNARMGAEGSDTQEDASQLYLPRHRFSPSARNSISLSTNPTTVPAVNGAGLVGSKPSRVHLASEPQSAIASAHPGSLASTPISANVIRSQTGRFFRGRGNGNMTDAGGTDDEHAVMPRRGFRNSMANLRKAGRSERIEFATATPLTNDPTSAAKMADQRAIVPDHLEVPVIKSPRALEKSRVIADTYADRAKQLATAQKQLVAVEKSLELRSEAGSRYLVEMDMLKQLFHEVADVEVVWPDLDLLIAAFALPFTDPVDRLNDATAAGGIKATNGRIPNAKRGLPHHMRNSASIGSASQSGSESDHLRMATHRRGSHRHSLSGANGHGRVDVQNVQPKAQSSRVDRISQAREAVIQAQGKYDDMRARRTLAEGNLRGLLSEIDEIHVNGKEDLAWFAARLDEIKTQKNIIAKLTPRGPKHWSMYISDDIFWRAGRVLVSTLGSLAQIEYFSRRPLQKFLGIRESTTWWTTIIRISILVACLGTLLAYFVGGGEGPVETPTLVRQPASWGGEIIGWGWRNARVGWQSMGRQLAAVST